MRIFSGFVVNERFSSKENEIFTWNLLCNERSEFNWNRHWLQLCHLAISRQEILQLNTSWSTSVFFNLFWFTAPCKTGKNLAAPFPG